MVAKVKKAKIRKTYKLAVIGGDGTGPEVVAEGLKVLHATASRYGFGLATQDYDFGGARYLRTGEVLPEGVVAELKQFDAIYLGAITTHYAPPMFSPDPADDWRRAVDAMVCGRFPLQRFISHRFGLSQIQGAFDAACQGLGGAYMKGIILNDLAEA